MPYTYFIIKPQKKQHIAVKGVDYPPPDWQSLKAELLEVAVIRDVMYNLTEGPIVLCQHLPGATANKTSGGAKAAAGGYGDAAIHYRRTDEFRCNLNYNSKTGEIKVGSPSFGSHTYRMRQEYKEECGDPYSSPPLVPKASLSEDPKVMLANPSIAKYANYSPEVKQNHNVESLQPRRFGSYCQQNVMQTRHYLQRSSQMREKSERRR